jgi:hypothetical protein
MSTLFGLLLLALIAWFWLDSLRAREIATEICRAACRQRDVQFLDQTVALRRLRVRWPANGVRLRRVYHFDYSEEGVGRHTGHIILLGIDLEELSMGLPSDGKDL